VEEEWFLRKEAVVFERCWIRLAESRGQRYNTVNTVTLF
jgi:hypothetical protein